MNLHNQQANAIRALSMDAVQKANSGHPGMPMGMADIASVLWHQFLIHSPQSPNWPNRDRFVLSNGHGSMLLYALLHLTGYNVSLDDLKAFRQLNSKTPGHPEHGHTPGVETTTGPLGQGIANAVGMALAEKLLANQFNKPEHSIINHHTYAFVGDGCLMEGISHEVCSLAGTLKLGKLITFYDDNGISIDGNIDGWFTDNTAERFKAYHWQVIGPIDGHNPQAIAEAITQAKENETQPSLIICKTHIGYGSPKVQDSAKSHGAPLGDEEIQATKAALGWPHAPFEIPQEIYQAFDAKQQGLQLEQAWQAQFEQYQAAYPQLAQELSRRLAGELPAAFEKACQTLQQEIATAAKDDATRKSSQLCLDRLTPALPELLGGSADLTGSNNTKWQQAQAITPEHVSGDYIYYGVREFGMAAMMNGLALHGGFIPFGGTFLVFSDYARNAIRLSAMTKQKVIHVLSHDSIGLGEDGPTHQPIEHISILRATPDLDVWRPADGYETAIAWQSAINHQGPSCLLLSRQTLPYLSTDESQAHKGGYVLRDCQGDADLIIMATGSEVHLATQAATELTNQGAKVRVVSMPCVEAFLRQDVSYQQSVLPPQITNRIAIEAGSPDSWYRFVGLTGKVIGISQFGYSAPYQQVYQALGLTTEAIIETARSSSFV